MNRHGILNEVKTENQSSEPVQETTRALEYQYGSQ
jgi:hypothetical protein